MLNRISQFFQARNINLWLVFFLLIYIVFVIKMITFRELDNNWLFSIYSALVSIYILSRFALSYLYVPVEAAFNPNYEPTHTFAVPSKNEGENIRQTILRIADSDYPKEKFNVIAVNDGSTDNTLEEMLSAQKEAREKYGVEVVVVDWPKNKGKREGMAECVRRSDKEIIVFIDSDSFVERNTSREMVKYFSDPKVAAISGHAYVANADKNFLTKMQAVRYFVAFKAYKAAEALFGSVTCCSGCCSAYRKAYVDEILDDWLHQNFLGVRCTYGDDRSLTNFLLKRGHEAVFSPTSITHTVVPDNFRQFMKQQLRWKKSWVRESFKAGLFMWKKNPIMSLSFYLGVILPILSPIIVIRALIWFPYTHGVLPWFYIMGLGLMAALYGIYYYVYTRDNKWFYGVVFAVVYSLILIWQLPYAFLTLRDSRWGTR